MLEIKIASSLDQVENAWKLVYSQYKRYNFIKSNPSKLWTYSPSVSNNNLTVCGYESKKLVATCSALVDSQNKLPLDHYFSNELDSLRAKGKKLMEVGLLADKRDNAKISKLLNLHMTLCGFGIHMKHLDVVIGCNPKSIKYYSSLGFKVIGENKSYNTLQNAPVTLLHGSMENDNPTNQILIPLVQDLLKKYDMESRYKFPKSELEGSLIDIFFMNQKSAYDYAR